MKLLKACLLLLVCLLPLFVSAQDDSKRYKTGQIKVGDRVLANAISVGEPDTCTVIGTVELTGAYMPGYTNQYNIRCDHKAWTTVAATGDKVQLAGQPNVLANGSAQAQQPPAGANVYGTRNPRTCAPLVAGMINTTLAAQLVACDEEKITGGNLYLVDDVVVSSLTAAHYDPYTMTGFSNMDTAVGPYAIRGRLVLSQCSRVDADFSSRFNNYGKNCARYNEKDARGYCYKMRTGAWRCNMSDLNITQADKQFNVAPPR